MKYYKFRERKPTYLGGILKLIASTALLFFLCMGAWHVVEASNAEASSAEARIERAEKTVSEMRQKMEEHGVSIADQHAKELAKLLKNSPDFYTKTVSNSKEEDTLLNAEPGDLKYLASDEYQNITKKTMELVDQRYIDMISECNLFRINPVFVFRIIMARHIDLCHACGDSFEDIKKMLLDDVEASIELVKDSQKELNKGRGRHED